MATLRGLLLARRQRHFQSSFQSSCTVRSVPPDLGRPISPLPRGTEDHRLSTCDRDKDRQRLSVLSRSFPSYPEGTASIAAPHDAEWLEEVGLVRVPRRTNA